MAKNNVQLFNERYITRLENCFPGGKLEIQSKGPGAEVVPF